MVLFNKDHNIYLKVNLRWLALAAEWYLVILIQLLINTSHDLGVYAKFLLNKGHHIYNANKDAHYCNLSLFYLQQPIPHID
jgi:hypothetical protein